MLLEMNDDNKKIIRSFYKSEKYYLKSFSFYWGKISDAKNNKSLSHKKKSYKIRKNQIYLRIRQHQYRKLIEKICYFYSRISPNDYKDSMVLTYTNMMAIPIFKDVLTEVRNETRI